MTIFNMIINYKINFFLSLIDLQTNYLHYNQIGTHVKKIKLNINNQILIFEDHQLEHCSLGTLGDLGLLKK